MTAYYNEHDLYAAQFLRNLIAANLIAPGDVDERSIEDVRPNEIRGYTQCHFFAGVGVWSLALRRAGWPDDRPVWTGSCPCQPFSAAGKGAAFDDERHLWPAFYHLIEEHAKWCRSQKRQPPVILGEQVASKDADPWIDLVQADMEALDYAFGCVPFPSASVGAPHIRDRNYWVAYATNQRLDGWRASDTRDGRDEARIESQRLCNVNGLDNSDHAGLEGFGRGYQAEVGRWREIRSISEAGEFSRVDDSDMQYQSPTGNGARLEIGRRPSTTGRLGYPHGGNPSAKRLQRVEQHGQQQKDGGAVRGTDSRLQRGYFGADATGPTNGHWRDADWLFCRDGKWRPVEPGTFPLAHGATARVGRLRAYGNAINAIQAQIFVEEVMECLA